MSLAPSNADWALNLASGHAEKPPEPMTFAEQHAARLVVGLLAGSDNDGYEVAADACEECGWFDAAEHLRELADQQRTQFEIMRLRRGLDS